MKKLFSLLLEVAIGFVLTVCNAVNTASPQVSVDSASPSTQQETLPETEETNAGMNFSEMEITMVNLGFISQVGGSLKQMLEQNDIRVLAALYAPLDGMNEKGLAVSVNMIQNNASIDQNTELEVVPEGQMEAGYCAGMSYMQTMRRFILPKAMRTIQPRPRLPLIC